MISFIESRNNMGFLTKMLISLRNTENWFSVDMLSFGYQIIFKTFTDNMRQSCLKLLPSTNTDNHDKYHGFDMNILPETLEVNNSLVVTTSQMNFHLILVVFSFQIDILNSFTPVCIRRHPSFQQELIL